MCDVCVASEAIRGVAIVNWPEAKKAVEVRAVGQAEGPARYKIRRAGAPWPRRWSDTDDLAGVMCAYGFDVKWCHVPPLVKEWVRGVGKLPTPAALKVSREAARSPRAAGRRYRR